ncbi:MAG: HNH endonuclease [Thermoanaerobaculia bacterium]|nr:HNH endonuclease [Thermoanaerobaculia bacterium]
MSVRIPKHLRNFVIERARDRCEYCKIPKIVSNYEFHIEHIIGIQHGGTSSLDNLAWCCSFCNWKKGPNLGTLLDSNNEIIPLFNPRTQNWFEHFDVRNGVIIPKTKIAMATVKLLEFNLPERVEIRAVLTIAGFYP